MKDREKYTYTKSVRDAVREGEEGGRREGGAAEQQRLM